MPNPFPGMNPYLEQSDYWSDFHNHLITALAKDLIPKLLPKYRVVTDKWVYKVSGDMAIAIGRPDLTVQQNRRREQVTTTVTMTEPQALPVKVTVPLLQEVRQSYIEVKDAATKEVVTAIEILSPANKRGDGRQKYESKRQQVLDSLTHLVEIDLLRDGEPLPFLSNTTSHYRILVSRSDTRPTADLYPFNLGDRIPPFELPVRSEDTAPVVELQKLVDELYEQLGYDYFINYSAPPPPPWSESEVVKWLP
ncbi:DUF4058 family protein [Scytonema sp. UIC 10036]|uniref:DUF4058 family protein n=1 Tax=Scytonema sp. UIC 10036 TaxID=2304196 RepID=UPI0012DA1BD7|nr:DUF4058 family protein [Scytonema sp. UIC 10036]MUH01561.1 DUF4058 family protein [Scytonema sp. UIC 10036]